ncbi:MAG: hypothetical protein AABW92_00495 [Nanoarchaeota archaeon]
MKLNKIYLIVISCFILIILSIYLIYSTPKKIELGITSDYFQDFKLQDMSRDNDIFNFNIPNKEEYLKIKILRDITFNQSKNYVSDKLFFVRSLYREINSPYPGQLSNKIACAEEFHPIEVEYSPFNYYTLYANNRFVYGVCTNDEIAYKSILYYHYCEEDKELYQLELFFGLDKNVSYYEDKLKETKCLIK